MNGDFDFDAWRQHQTARRSTRLSEIESALRRGLIVRQADTFWSIAGCVYTRHGIRADATFIEPFQSDASYLASHLENREYGFGLETVILRTL